MNPKIICMSCPLGTPEISESQYRIHMETVHGGSQAAGRLKQNNIPVPNTPLPKGITPADLPNAEFMATIAEIEKAKSAPPPPPKPAQPQAKIIQTAKLTYKYEGMCSCGNNVATLEMDIEGKHFVVAYCLIEKRQVESREVANLTPSAVTETSPLPSLKKAEVNDKSQKDLAEGVPQTEVPIITQNKRRVKK